MRLPGGAGGASVLEAALDAGVTLFDTARAYGDSERLVGQGLRGADRAQVITKGGMSRPGGAWVPDGRAKSIRADCEASLSALDGVPIAIYLLHAPDPRVPWATSVRALGRLVDEGLVAAVGVSNVTVGQLEEASALAPISAVEVAVSVVDDRAVRGGVVEWCSARGITVIAHSPLGGPRRAGRLARRDALLEVAARHGATPAEVALAWVLALGPGVVAIPGCSRVDTVRSAVRAGGLVLDPEDRSVLGGGRRAPSPAPRAEGEVTLVMGIPGAGKTRHAARYVDRGYVRLNRDERGGTLKGIAAALDDALAGGAMRVVLDNTYLSRSARSLVVDAAARHGLPVRCVFVDTPLDQAQVNLVGRLLERFGALPSPEELRAASRHEPGLLSPTQQMRAVRELEPPSNDEGFSAIERVPFTRGGSAESLFVAGAGVLVAAAAVERDGWERALDEPAAPHLVFDWRPERAADDLRVSAERLRAVVGGPVSVAVCPHPGGPPICWCRPPLPGLALAFAREHGLGRLTVVGASPAHRTMARALGARYVEGARGATSEA